MAVPKRAFSVSDGPLRNPCSFSIPFGGQGKESTACKQWSQSESSQYSDKQIYQLDNPTASHPIGEFPVLPWWQRRCTPCLLLSSACSWTWARRPAGGPSPRLCPRPRSTARSQSTTQSRRTGGNWWWDKLNPACVWAVSLWRGKPSWLLTCFPLSESMTDNCFWALMV